MYTKILHATDLAENHYAMAEKALAIAKAFNGELYLLHAIEPPPSLQIAQGLGFAEFDSPIKDDAVAVMRVLGEALGVPEANQFIEIGSIKTHVLEEAARLGCDLIIIGSHTPNALPAFLDSSAHEIVYQALCDVMTIRAT